MIMISLKWDMHWPRRKQNPGDYILQEKHQSLYGQNYMFCDQSQMGHVLTSHVSEIIN